MKKEIKVKDPISGITVFAKDIQMANKVRQYFKEYYDESNSQNYVSTISKSARGR